MLFRPKLIYFGILAGCVLIYCGLTVMHRSSDSTLVTSSEDINFNSLSVSEQVTRNNTKQVHSISYKPKSMTTDRQAVTSETTMTTDSTSATVTVTASDTDSTDATMAATASDTDTTSATVTVTASDTDGTSATMATTPSDTIRVEQIKNLYDSEMIRSHGIKLQWIRNRMTAMASTWDKAAHNLSLYYPSLFSEQRRILLFPGLLVDKYCSQCYFAENAFKGGPLGELVQWTDLISSLFMLGHKITIVTTPQGLAAVRGDDFDVIFSDYLGLKGLQDTGIIPQHYCKIRVLDTFGSEPLEIFNADGYASQETNWYFRSWKFQNTKQFWNLYPHTPDNSFLGFAMETPEQEHKGKKQNIAVIYGKEENYMAGRENYVAAIGTMLELHSTFKRYSGRLRNTNIINHGIVDHATLSGLLQSAKLFIGLGFPYEGPGPLEALANGCPYIQPKFIPPRGRENEKFFKLKPTTRKVTSQSPYLEDFVGEPYVFTVDASDISAVKEVVDKVIKRGDLPPHIPYEFTQQGMMERVGAFVIYQDFCRGNNLKRTATSTASSEDSDHPASHAIDDDPEGQTCYHSKLSSHSWWEADFGSEVFIKEIFIQLKITEHLHNTSYVMSLRDSAGFDRTHKLTIDNSHLMFTWTNIETMARYVRIDARSSVPDQLIICRVDIYGTPTFWPKPSLLKVIQSKSDESCTTTCTDHHMLCEHSFFPLVNTFKALHDNFNCKTMEETAKYMNIFPSYIQSEDKDNGFVAGSCVTTKINPLLSCNGHRQGYLRLCPCRQYRRGQVALPIEL